MFSVHTIFQNICKSEKVQIPPVVEVAVLQFHERWQLPELSSSFFFFCCNAISRIISSCVVSLVNFRGSYQQFWDFSGNFIFPHPLLLPFLLPLVPHEVEEEKGVLVWVCQVADRGLRNRPVHLNLQTKLEPFKSTNPQNEGTCLDALHGEVAVERRPLHVAGLARVLVFFQVLGTHSSLASSWLLPSVK